MNEYNPDKTARDDYTGAKIEPQEDRSIIQPDGTRACYNWECADKGFEPIKNSEKLGLDSEVKQGLTELGILAHVKSIDDLLNTDVWCALTPEQQTEAYFLLEKAEQKDISIVPYDHSNEDLIRPLLAEFQREEEHEVNEKKIYRNVECALKDLKEGRDNGILAFLGDDLVGFQITHQYNNQADEFRGVGTLEFTQSYVQPSCRRQGIGRKMKEFCLQQILGDAEISTLLAVIDEENIPSRRLHENLGLENISHYDDGIGRTYFVYQIDVTQG